MKLSRIYSNDDSVFPAIEFHDGFNVVFARVRNPAILEQDSHNLGKTFLIHIIDFVLLTTVKADHPFRQHSDLFGSFSFYLEIETHAGLYVTVRRKVQGNPSISLFISPKSQPDLRALPDEEWTFPKLSSDRARGELDRLLDLTVIKPFTFRKGLGYVLRTQSDYDDVFRISRFGRGKDRDWKPFVAQLLGFDANVLSEKYMLDQRIEELEQYHKIIERDAGSTSARYDEVKGLIEIRTAYIERLRADLDTFSFSGIEAQLNRTVVQEIEASISEQNERRYTIDYELQEIDRSLGSQVKFDLEQIRQIFSETQISFPEQLARSYEELLDFNRRLSSSRVARLQLLRSQLQAERDGLEVTLDKLNTTRTEALAILKEQETFEKYRVLQGRVIDGEREIAELNRRLEMLDRATTVRQDIDLVRQERSGVGRKIREQVRGDNATYKAVRRLFSNYVERVLNVPALLSVTVNEHDNIEFNVRTLDRTESERETSEGAGTSYRKLLCACFDLALLSVHASQGFYHFVYHDGIFEGLDNRKKVNLMDVIRSVCTEFKLQHILTVIDSDLPRDDRDQKLLFTSEEVVRDLHEEGPSGRLFRMPAF